MFTKRDCEGFHRRDFLQVGSAGLLGLTLPNLLRAEGTTAAPGERKAKAKGVILVWLGGGPATIDMWDNKPEAPEGIRGEFKSIDTKAKGVQFSEHLPKMAEVADKISVVRSLAHTIPSHGPGTVFMTTGNKPTPALQYPALGSLCARMMTVDKGVPPYVSFQDLRNGTAGNAGYLGAAYNPFGVEGGAGGKGGGGGNLQVRGITLPQGFTLEDLDKRDKLLAGFDRGFKQLDTKGNIVEGLDAFHQQALDILRSDKTKKAFDLAKEKETVRDSYGKNPFGQGALAARRLIEAGVRFVTISTGGWDTHGQNFTNLKTKLLPNLDVTLAALIADLDARGMLDSTIVMCAGEFGRTPKINKNAGRDHWARSMACVLAGGGIKRGYAHGTTDASGMAPATEPVTPDDVASTIFTQLGVDPHTELQTPTGRPVQLFREGKAIEKLIA
jgi:Protein of unknown function (DUF1501)